MVSKSWRLTAAGVVAVLFGHEIASFVLKGFGLKTLTVLAIGEVISLALLILLMGSHWRQIMTISPKHLGVGIAMIWPAAFIILINMMAGIQTDASISHRILAVVVALMVAIFEEGLFRGVIFGTLREMKWPAQLWGQMAVSAVIFGGMHLFNLFHSAAWQGTLLQVIYAFALGMLFAAVTYRTQSLLPTILCHWLIDAAGLQGSQAVAGNPNFVSIVIYLVFSGVTLLWALWLTRPSKQIA